MCGFVGVIDPAGLCSPEALSDASAKLIHRGPDDAGVWSDGPVAMAHRRLAILDLSPTGHQPMVSHNGRLEESRSHSHQFCNTGLFPELVKFLPVYCN